MCAVCMYVCLSIPVTNQGTEEHMVLYSISLFICLFGDKVFHRTWSSSVSANMLATDTQRFSWHHPLALSAGINGMTFLYRCWKIQTWYFIGTRLVLLCNEPVPYPKVIFFGICIWTCLYVYMHVCMSVCKYVFIFVSLCLYIKLFMSAHAV